jgi:hypothetical protein
LSTCTALSTRISGLMMWRRSDVRQWRKVDNIGRGRSATGWMREDCGNVGKRRSATRLVAIFCAHDWSNRWRWPKVTMTLVP